MSESRRHGRLRVAGIPCRMIDSGKAIEGQIANLSVGGALITCKTSSPSKQDDEISIAFSLDKVDYLLHARISRENAEEDQTQFGIEWVRKGNEGDEKLYRLFDALLLRGGGGNRRHPRVERRMPVTVSLGNRTCAATIADLSRGGAALLGTFEAKPGTQLTLRLLDLSGKPWSIEGQIIYQRSLANRAQRTGIAFHEPNLEQLNKLDALIEDLLGAVPPDQK